MEKDDKEKEEVEEEVEVEEGEGFWEEDESSSSWDDADIEFVVGEEGESPKVVDEAQGLHAGFAELTPQEPAVEAIEVDAGAPSLRRRRTRTWKEDEDPLEAWRGDSESSQVSGSDVSVDFATALASALEDGRGKGKQRGVGVILGSPGDEIEVEESESHARGSLASFSFQGSVQSASVESDECSTQVVSGSSWPPGLESDEEEEVLSERRRVEEVEQIAMGTIPVREVGESECSDNYDVLPVKEVYKFPVTDEILFESGDAQGQLLLLPAAFIIRAIGFQVKLIARGFSLFLWILNLCCSLFWKPISKTLEAKDLAAGTINQGVSYVSQLRPRISEGASNAGPKVGRLWKKMGISCLAGTYVVFVLALLLIPAVVVDYLVISRFVEEPIEVKEVLHFDYTQPKPSAVVNLLPPKVMARAKAHVAAHPEKIIKARAIPLSHKFHVTLVLTLPESDYNRHLGLFQISVELLSIRGQVLARSGRPCMLAFRSSPIRYAKTLFLGLPLLMGLSQELQTMSLRILESQEERVIPTVSVRTILEAKAGYPVGQGLPELYSAEILIQSQLPWLKALIYSWRLTFYVWSTFWWFFMEVALVLLCCRKALMPTSWSFFNGDSEEEGEASYALPAASGSKAIGAGGHGIIKKALKTKKRVSFQDEIPTADVVPNPESVETPELSLRNSAPVPRLEESSKSVQEIVQNMEKIVRDMEAAGVQNVALRRPGS